MKCVSSSGFLLTIFRHVSDHHFFDTQNTPNKMRTVPAACHKLKGSPRICVAMIIVASGPTVEMMAALPAPISFMPSATIKVGITVQNGSKP